MKIAGTYKFAATREEVWSAINDPEVLARTIPGCERLEQVGENEYESTLKIGLQAIKGTYSGRVRLEDVQPPEHYKIVLDGKGTNGFVQGAGTVDLAEDGDSTKITYGGDAQVGGTIASVGQRLIEGASKTLINQSLKALAAQIEARKQPAANPDTNGTAPTNAETSEGDANQSAPQPAAEPQPDAPTEAAQEAAAAADSEQALMTRDEPSQDAPPAPLSAQNASTTTTPTFERRSIVVPEGEGLSDADVARGVVMDFYNERPWLPWVVVAFLLGYLFGREMTR